MSAIGRLQRQGKLRLPASLHPRLAVSIPAFPRAPVRGISVALRHSVFCFATRPFGFRFLPKQIRSNGKERRVNFFGSLRKTRPSALGSRPTPAASPCVPRVNSGDQNGETDMYLNRITLIGFLGNDAEVH